MTNLNIKSKHRGFTIVELLVVIVVIGILAAISVVSYNGITAQGNTSAAQSAANAVIAKATTFAADSTSNTWPLSYTALTQAATSATYYLSPEMATFTTFNGTLNNAATGMSAQPTANDTIDYYLCGPSGSYATAAAVPTGVEVGYWKYSPAGIVKQSVGTNTNCYLVGPEESVLAVAIAMKKETGNYPSTAAAFTSSAASVKVPTGYTVGANTTPDATLNLKTIKYECYATSGTTCTGSITGVRVTYWDSTLATPAVATLTYGASTGGSYQSPAS